MPILAGTWGEINVGLGGQMNRATTLFANGSYQRSFEGNSYAVAGKLGLRVNW